MAVKSIGQFFFLAVLGGTLAACTAGTSNDAGLGPDGQPILDATVNAPTTVKLVDRDVEAPEVFQAEGLALWDGRPSLGGVWVASPDAKDPERVILRNPADGKFVIGALFRREWDNPGPKLQISSDAAEALGILAGKPTTISVTALRREEGPAPAPAADQPILDSAETLPAESQPSKTQAGTDVAASAAKAIDQAEATAAGASPAPARPTQPAPAKTEPATTEPATTQAPSSPAPAAGAVTTQPLSAIDTTLPTATGPGKLIQIGIFSIEANAQTAVDKLKAAGVTATIKKNETQGKPYWSVTARGDKALLDKIKAAGFADAYFL